MDAVILKGRADGFELQLATAASFAEIKEQLEKLLAHLHEETPTDTVGFVVETGKRLFTDEQRQELENVFDKFPRFTIRLMRSDVVESSAVAAKITRARTSFAGGIVRSGQVLSFPGDVVFTGDLHKGGTIRANGSIYVMGSAEGVVHAGYPQNGYAVVAGRLTHLTQVRIADTVDVVEDENYPAAAVSYINDQHLLVHAELSKLQDVRPQIFESERMEES
ncbi:septum site-determining protein MinC [Lacticaseibacillus pabuli]|uniref:Probable septum site-determining protein MinC n=1 Tax=Lacticaseibacillus pabuli TaxID=3025672 RepID=A0ABY7WPU1_9LACO|nr:septum site-determining protein MinC [Lacticaseibacillus sp. KACC 23028]WDF81686.1 septum site-determining protein MinC [Lacticaseibacillus sp. KACC 23028]